MIPACRIWASDFAPWAGKNFLVHLKDIFRCREGCYGLPPPTMQRYEIFKPVPNNPHFSAE